MGVLPLADLVSLVGMECDEAEAGCRLRLRVNTILAD